MQAKWVSVLAPPKAPSVLLSLFWGIYATDVSRQPVGPIFKGQEMQVAFLDFLTLKDGTDMLPRNVGTELPTYAT